jgi:hypothetical protein
MKMHRLKNQKKGNVKNELKNKPKNRGTLQLVRMYSVVQEITTTGNFYPLWKKKIKI